MANKFGRGATNILTGWVEIPKTFMITTKANSNNFVLGIVAAVFQGGAKAIARTLSGICDIVTAPIAPEKGPFIQPDIDI